MRRTILTVLAFSLLAGLCVRAAAPGLPFTEDFFDTQLMDSTNTTANWSTTERRLALARRRAQFGAFGAGTVKTSVTSDLHSSLACALGDMDGDGDIDVVVGNDNGTVNRLYLNNHDGSFAAGLDISVDTNNTRAIAVGDLDGDGDLDVVAGNYGEPDRVYLNNGTADPFNGVLGHDVDSGDTAGTTGIALGDMDKDGDPDVVVANYTGPNRLYLGNGDGTFAAGTDIAADSGGALTLGDMNGDGNLDVIVARANSPNRLYLNNGTLDPFNGVTGLDISADADWSISIAVGDLDGDTDLDVVVGNGNLQTNRFYLNNGTADPFNGVVGTDLSSDACNSSGLALADVDGDGDLDVIVGDEVEPNKLHLNRGDALFSPATEITATAHDTREIGLGDMDGDGDVDLVTSTDAAGVFLYVNPANPNPFDGVTGVAVTADAYDTFGVTLGDVDRDGDIDAVVGNLAQPNRLYLNNGDGTFAAGSNITADAQNTYVVALGDLDRDGDPDLVAGNENQPNRVYTNNGDGTFAAGTDISADTNATMSVALVDIDSDGDLDLIEANYGQPNRVYLNNGDATFAAGTDLATDADNTEGLAVGDIDRDGDLDVVVANTAGQRNRVYLNNGDGTFASGTDIAADADNSRAIALGDIDGDGHLDVVVGNEAVNRAYLGNGDGTFGAGVDIAADADSTEAVALDDLDGDGRLDFVAGNYGSRNRVYANAGSGTFGPGADVGSEAEDTTCIGSADLDGDGVTDVVAGNRLQANRLYRNAGACCAFGGIVAGNIDQDSLTTSAIAVGDVDGDGDLDVVTGQRGSAATNLLYLRDEGGKYASALPISADVHDTYGLVLCDLDGDGDLDVAAGNYGAVNRVYFNNGTADPFSGAVGSDVSGDVRSTYDLCAGDVDGDGCPDLVSGNFNEANRLYLGNGDGTYTAAGDITTDAHATCAVALGDLDGDGHLDLAAGNLGEANRIYLNNGTTAPFNGVTGYDVAADTNQTWALALADLDRDGDLDLVAGNLAGPDRVYLNNGNGTFAAGQDVNADANDTWALALADIDRDGDIDIVAGNNGQRNRLALNNGDGTFQPGLDVADDSFIMGDIAVADLDGDGLPDIVAGNEGAPNTVYSRRLHHTAAGSAASLEVDTESGEISNATLAAMVNAPPNTAIDWYLSNNGGATWLLARPGVQVVFPGSGNDLRWRAELHSLSPALSPEVTRIDIDTVPPPVWFEVYGISSPTTTGTWETVTVEAWRGSDVWTDYVGTITFDSIDPGATLPPDYTFTPGDNGVHTFAAGVAFSEPHSHGQINVMDTVDTGMWGDQHGIVVFGGTGTEAETYWLWGVPDPILTGEWASVSLAAVDWGGRLITDYTGTVVFSSSDGAALLPNGGAYDFQPADSGLHTFSDALQFNAIGEHWLRAEDNADPGIVNDIIGITVQGDGASTNVTHLVVEGVNFWTLTNEWLDVIVETRNEYEHTVQEFEGWIEFDSSDPAAMLPGAVHMSGTDAGRIQLFGQLQLNTPGTHWVEARLQADTNVFGRQFDIEVATGTGPGWFEVDLPKFSVIDEWTALELTAYDSSGNIDAGYTGTVVFTSSDPAAVFAFTNYTFTPADQGVKVFDALVVFVSAGCQTVRVEDASKPEKWDEDGTDVLSPGAAETTHFLLWGVRDPLLTNEWTSVSVAAVDWNWDIDTGYTGTIVFSSSDGAAVLPNGGLYAFDLSDNGVHTFSNELLFATIGEHWLRVEDQASPDINNELRNITVQGDGFSTNVTHFVVDGFSWTMTNEWGSIGIEARNEFEQVVSSFTGWVDFFSSDPAAVLPNAGAYCFTPDDAGWHWFNQALQFNTAGTHWFEARLAGDTNILGGFYDIEVSDGTGPPGFSIDLPKWALAGEWFTIAVTAETSGGKVDTHYTGTVTFASSDPGAELPPDYTFQPADQGVKVFSNAVRFANGGWQSIEVADVADPSRAGDEGVAVYMGGALVTTRFEVWCSASIVQSNTWYDCLVMALGDGGLVNTNHTAEVTFSSSDPAAAFGVNPFSAFVNGHAGLPNQVQWATPGNQTLHVALSADTNVWGECSVFVVGGGQTYYVRQSMGSDANAGLTPGSAWASITRAGQTAQGGDTVFVGRGDYPESAQILNSGAADLWLAFLADENGLYTGDAGDVRVRSGPDPAFVASNRAYVVLSGFEMNGEGAVGSCGLEVEGGDHWIVIGNEVDGYETGMRFRGVLGARVIGNELDECGMVGIQADLGSHLASIEENDIEWCGVGISVSMSTNVVVKRNSVRNADTGGIQLMGADGDIVRNDVCYNAGFGIRGESTGWAGRILRNLVFGNGEAGVLLSNADPGWTVVNNTCVDNGDGLRIEWTQGAVVRNNIFAFNLGAGIVVDSTSTAAWTHQYNCCFGNATNWADSAGAGAGSISADPLFADATPGQQDFHLQSTAGRWTHDGWTFDAALSPCIDAGDPADAYEYEPMPNGGRVNMGAYGNTWEASRNGYLVRFASTASMGSEAVASMDLLAWLNAVPTNTVTVDFVVTGGTAVNGTDYTPAAGTLTFSTGVDVLNLPIAILDDAGAENNETLDILLANPVDCGIGTPELHTYTILDDDRTFTAYNDLGWTNGQLDVNITWYTTDTGPDAPPAGNAGCLLDYPSGQLVPAAVTVSGGGWQWASVDTQGEDALAGTDADAVFGGVVDCLGLINYLNEPTNLTIACRGLNPALRYEVVLFGNRAMPAYTDRISMITISDVASFANWSTPGADFAGTTDDSVRISHGDNTANGYVARFTKIDPGPDGDLLLTVSDGGSAEPPKFYANALMLRATQATPQAMLVVEGSPARYGISFPYGYGTNRCEIGETLTNSVASPFGETNGTRYVCTGWTGTGDVPSPGTTNELVFTISAGSTLTWQWQTEYFLDTTAGANGSVDVADGWHAAGSGVSVSATPASNYCFAEWTGDVPGGSETANPLTLTMDQPRAITAAFAPAFAPGSEPGGLTATTLHTDRVDLAWLDNSTNETQFVIERSADAFNYAPAGYALADATGFSDPTPSPGHYYYYRVKATNAWGETGCSDPARGYCSPGTAQHFAGTWAGDVTAGLASTNLYGRAEMRFQPDGLPVIAYGYQNGGYNQVAVHVAWWDGTSWVGRGGSATETGLSGQYAQLGDYGPRLRLDANGNPHVAWMYNGTGFTDIYYSYWDGAAWRTVGSTNLVCSFTGNYNLMVMGLDSAGNPHIAWENPGSEIRLLKGSGANWVGVGGSDGPGGLSLSGSANHCEDIVIDPAGQIYVTYLDSSAGPWCTYMKYWNGAAWTGLGGSDSGTGLSPNQGYARIALAADGRPVLAWAEDTHIVCRAWDGAQWAGIGSDTNGTVFAGAGSCQVKGFFLTSDGDPVISWDEAFMGPYHVYCRKWDGIQWRDMGAPPVGETPFGFPVNSSLYACDMAADDKAGGLIRTFGPDAFQIVSLPRDRWDFTIAGNPAPHGVAAPHDYGTHSIPSGATLTHTVPSPADELAGTRYVCTGWTGTGDVPANGTSNTLEFTITTNSSVTWNWETEYFLDTTAGANGSVDVTDGWHASNTAVAVAATPIAGYHLENWTGAVPAGSETNNPLALTMDKPRAVTANFARDTGSITINVTPDTGSWTITSCPADYAGPTSGAGDLPATAAPSGSYTVEYGLLTGYSSPTPETATVWDATATPFTGAYLINTYTITASAGADGAITPAGAVPVTHGSATNFTIAPNANYHVADVTVDGLSVGAITYYEFVNVVTDRTIQATFAIDEYSLTVVSAHGTPAPGAGAHAYPWNTALACAVPDSPVTLGGTQYVCVGWTGLGNVPASGTTTNTPVFNLTQASTITWNWQTEYWLDTVAGANGTVDIGDAWHASGATVSINATPAAGYHFQQWTGSVPVGSETDNPLMLTMDMARTVTANFARDVGTITINVTPDSGSWTITSCPADYAGPASGTGDLASTAAPSGSYTVEYGAVTGYSSPAPETAAVSHGVATPFTGTYLINTYTITASAGANGTITPSGAVPITHGSSTNFVITANATYHIADVLVDGGSVGPTNAYTFANVGTNHAIAASFARDTGTITINVTPDTGSWAITSHPADYAGPTSGAGDLASTAAPSGSYTVQYGALTGYTKPGDQTQPVVDGQNTAFTGTYTIFTYTLSVASAHGTGTPAAGTHIYDYGTSLTCAIGGSPEIAGGTRYTCTGWTGTGNVPASGSGTTTPGFTLTQNSGITWNWQTAYYLDTTAGAHGSVNVGDGWYNAGAQETITATADSGYHFTQWTGDVPGGQQTSNPLTLTLDQARSVTANFAIDTGDLTVTIRPPAVNAAGAQWRVTSGPDTAWHASGETINIPGGAYTATFNMLSGWKAPADLSGVTVTNWTGAAYAACYMVRLPGGTYQMGYGPGEPGYTVTLSPFYIDPYEVSVREYRRFCQATGRTMPTQWWAGEELPVVNVNWTDANAYVGWAGKRLPTEAEWEYAARGGLRYAKYPCGNSINQSDANYGNSLGRTTNVGSYAANAYGLYDVGGNAWEWCADWYAETLQSGVTNPVGPPSGTDRVIRGGSWWTASMWLRCDERWYEWPTAAYDELGFRCAANAPAGPPDADADTLPDDWEQLYFGSPTAADGLADPDGDGSLNWQECVAGTDPTNAASYFAIFNFRRAGTQLIVEWLSLSGRVYDVESATNLPAGFTPLATGLGATPPTNAYSDGPAGMRFYRVKVYPSQ
ncbi:MAG: VCBS repeat-containing protein [Kiritimatiellae bacterium]|nr:VCBS repeat-containing protein [Kiritimatiellia bacterium]